MEDIQITDELSQWFSTYGVITADRILGTYQISIPPAELVVAVKSPFSFYHQLIQVPLKNVLNGIVFQQANDYHIYAQKLFIDYLLSGESGKGPDSQGALTRESLEEERVALVNLGNEFNKKQSDHEALIASSQASFIKTIKEWKAALESAIKQISATLAGNNMDIQKSQIRQALNHALVHCNLATEPSPASKLIFVDKMNEVLKLSLSDEVRERLVNDLSELLDLTINFFPKIKEYWDRAIEMGEQAQAYRTQFYETILRVTDLIKLLPEYKIDPAQDEINREPLYFDKTIGQLKG